MQTRSAVPESPRDLMQTGSAVPQLAEEFDYRVGWKGYYLWISKLPRWGFLVEEAAAAPWSI
jgi:hypothetical protein